MSSRILRLVAALAATVALPASAQYVATTAQGVTYPALTNPQPIPLVATGTLDPMDRGRFTLPIPFAFPYYGRSYTQVVVTANGLAAFETVNQTTDFLSNTIIPSGGDPNGVLAPLWDDLIGNNPTSAIQSQAVTGPNGQGLAIEWKDWNRSFGSFSLTFQIRLWENGIVEFFYGSMTGSGSTTMTATVGIESPTGTVGVYALSNCTSSCALASFDPLSTGSPINYVRFGPPAGIDLLPTRLLINGIGQTAGNLDITTALTMQNFGTQQSGAFTYRLFLSSDTLYDVNDTALTPAPQGPFDLAALAVMTSTVTVSAPRPASGSWYILAVVDDASAVTETNEANNNLGSSVPYAAGVDLVAQSVRGPPVVGPGDPVSIDVGFSNQGFDSAGAVNVKLWVSADATISADDLMLVSTTINVAGGQQVQQPVTFTMPSGIRADDYLLMLQLDDGPAVGAITERSEANNTVFSAARMTVRQADLVITEVRVKKPALPYPDTAIAFFGEPIRLEAYVTNAGGATAPSVRVAFYLSDNETLNAITDPFVGEVANLPFPPGTSQWVTLPASVVPTTSTSGMTLQPQNYFFFAAAISGVAETNPGNNFLKSVPIGLRNPGPNYAPVNVRAPLKIGAGEIVAVTRTLGNFGNRPGATVKYRYFLSANQIITRDDIALPIVTQSGDVPDKTVSLAVGAQDTAVDLVRVPPNVPAARFFVGVLIDPDEVIAETQENDNGLASPSSEVVPLGLSLANPFLPDALVGEPYFVQLAGRGATGPYSFRMKDAAELPEGLTLSTSGELTGTPKRTGAFGMTFIVEANGRTAEARRSLRVASSTTTLAISTLQLPAPVRLVAYDATIGAAGGIGPYTFSLAGGALPQGITLATSGRLSGTTNLALGTMSTFVVRVADFIGNSDLRAFTLITVDGAPFTIQTTSLPPTYVGADYVKDILAANPSGAPVSKPVRWALIGGALPPGLTIEESTSERVILSGTPKEAGLYRFTLEAVDSQGRADSVNYLLPVSSGVVAISGTVPDAVAPGAEVSVQLTTTPSLENAQWVVRDGTLPPGLSLSPAGLLSGTVDEQALRVPYNFSIGVGASRDSLFVVRPLVMAVSDTAGATKPGCSATGGDVSLLAGAIALLLTRRRRTPGLIPERNPPHP